MSYDYTVERKNLLSESGIATLLRVRDTVKDHLKKSGAFRLQEAGISDWLQIAAVDYLVEIKELVEFERDCWGQFRVFTSPDTHNR